MNINQVVSRRQFLVKGVVAGGGLLAGLGTAPLGSSVKAISPIELLSRDHGLMRRVFFIYEEILRRFCPTEDQPTDLIREATKVYQKVANDFHEKMEDDYLFPVCIKADLRPDLAAVLSQQHIADHRLIVRLLGLTSAAIFKNDSNRSATRDSLCVLTRMMEPHMAWEESELYPAFLCAISAKDYREMGDVFLHKQDQIFGCNGVKEALDTLAELEGTLGLNKLANFTPPQ